MNKNLLPGVVLLVIGLICGVLLAFINSITAPIIKANADKIILDSLAEVYTGASSYNLTEEEGTGNVDKLFILSDKTSGDTVAIIYSVKAEGYQSTVNMLIAVEFVNSSEYIVKGYKVVSQGETSGIGDKIVNHDFKMVNASITNLSTFDAVSGATFSSGAVRTCFESVSTRVASDFGGAQ